MTKNTDEFLKEGMSRYKQATLVYFTFRKELQNKLQSILRSHKDWGKVVPNFKTIKSTTFGQEYPLLNSRIEAMLENEPLTLVIALSWYQAEGDFPIFTVWVENYQHASRIDRIVWGTNFEYINYAIRCSPDPENYDLDKELKSLFSEFIRGLNTLNENNE